MHFKNDSLKGNLSNKSCIQRMGTSDAGLACCSKQATSSEVVIKAPLKSVGKGGELRLEWE